MKNSTQNLKFLSYKKFNWQLILLLLVPVWLQAIEIKFVAEHTSPELGEQFNVFVLSTEVEQVAGIDLRFQFDVEAVELQNFQTKKISQFQWFRNQANPELGYAITGIMFPQSNQTIDLKNNDTLAVATFFRLNSESTSISLKSAYPIMIDKNLKPISCSTSPLNLAAVTAVDCIKNSPVSFALKIANYPNPFNSTTQFIFVNQHQPQQATIEIFDIGGRLVWCKKIVASTGENRINWRGIDLVGKIAPSGLYFSRLIISQKISRGKCLIIR